MFGSLLMLVLLCGVVRTVFIILLLLLCTLLLFSWLVEREKANWPKGLLGQQLIYEWSGCSIPNDFTPWAAIIPMQLAFFIRGRLICRPSHFEPFSWIDENNTLTVLCPSTALVIEGRDFLEERKKRNELNEEDQLSLYNRTRNLLEIRYNYSGPTKIQREYVQIFCEGKENFHVRNIPNLSKFIGDFTQLSNHTKSHSDLQTTTRESLPSPPLNVFLIMIDALSRSHSLRKLPKTLSLLEEFHKSGHFSLFQYFRYHVLGIHSRPNLIPIYTGATEGNYKGEPLYFEYFNREKYIHLWLHGSCQDFFQDYVDDRFPPSLDYEVILPFCHPSYHAFGKQTTGNFQGPYSIVARCIAGRMVHHYMLDYLRSFLHNHQHLRIGKTITSVWLEAHEGFYTYITYITYIKRTNGDPHSPSLSVSFQHKTHIHINKYSLIRVKK
jgi:hypothetical protein